MRIETVTNDRKALAKAVAEFAGSEAKYVGPPTFAYTAGGFAIARDGAVTAADDARTAELKAYLQERGFVEADSEDEKTEVSLPINGMETVQFVNLIRMLHSRQYLLNKSIGLESFKISEELLRKLEQGPPESVEAFLETFGEYENGCKGILFGDGKVRFSFPHTDNADRIKAYMELSSRILARAKEAKRVEAEEQKPENEKYYFRIWLVRLGLDGKEYKDVRKVLMEKLRGHSAFRTEAEKLKWQERRKARNVTVETTP